jgi:hypothetical protein
MTLSWRKIKRISTQFQGRIDTVLSLLIIGIIALSLRLYYFPYDVPLTLDALNDYFLYANDVSILGHLPTNFSFANNGWPMFLSFFFSIFHFNNYLDYMILQRIVSVVLSVLTIIPVYLLCNKFVSKPYSLAGAAIFAFEPRIIQNSVLGITEPLYFFLLTFTLVLFFSSHTKIRYLSFGIAALTSLVRAEGLFLFVALSVLYFILEKKNAKIIGRYSIAIIIFLLVILPMAYLRIQAMGYDGLTGNFNAGVHNTTLFSSQKGNGIIGIILFVINGIENYFKYLGWVMIPIFVFFVPIGIFLMKKQNRNLLMILILIIILSLPPLYVYAMGIQETRYLYVLYPLFCVISIFTIKSFVEKFKKHNMVLTLVIGGILLSSIAFLDVKQTDYEHQREAYSLAQKITRITGATNDYYPEDSYLTPVQIPEKWPVLSSSVKFHVTTISTAGFNSLNKYIESSESKGLTHLIVDGGKNRPNFLNDVFYHDEKYPFLVKVFDSEDSGYKYHLKVYSIDYNKFDQYDK